MIIDEILDTIDLQKKLDIDYIKKEAEYFDFADILQAIEQKDTTALKTALKNYIIQNEYNNNILQDIDKIKIDFTTKADIMEEIETTLFFTSELNNIIFDILEDMEELTVDEFIYNFDYKLNESSKSEYIKWELLKNYTSPEEVNKINYNDILQEFYNDIRKILEV